MLTRRARGEYSVMGHFEKLTSGLKPRPQEWPAYGVAEATPFQSKFKLTHYQTIPTALRIPNGAYLATSAEFIFPVDAKGWGRKLMLEGLTRI